MARPGVGELLRDWRSRRHRSQMDVALDVAVSTRHLSFVETGRSRPSPELVLAIANVLDVPLRERNTLLLAAGYAPRYSQTPLDDPSMSRVRASVQRMLDAHDPYPGVVIDRLWNVVLNNSAAALLLDGIPEHVLGPTLNVYRVCLHPDGLAARTVNFDDWATYLLGQLRRSILLTGDAALHDLADEVRGYPDVARVIDLPRSSEWDDPPLLVPLEMQAGDEVLSLFTTLTAFGTPLDVTLDEIAVELFFPADDRTEAILRGEPVVVAAVGAG
jgi:transcriptional regulator with XRE-family HTH domain